MGVGDLYSYLNENEDMTTLSYGRGDDFYCRYEGENNQRHQEPFRLNIAGRTDWAMEGR